MAIFPAGRASFEVADGLGYLGERTKCTAQKAGLDRGSCNIESASPRQGLGAPSLSPRHSSRGRAGLLGCRLGFEVVEVFEREPPRWPQPRVHGAAI
jgi:hypothetical protein